MTGSILGFVFNDKAGNGVMDPGDVGLPDFPVKLYESETPDPAKLLATCSTNAQGTYMFPGLAAGKYYVYVTNYRDKFTPTGKSATYFQINLAAGQVSTSNNFGQKPIAPAPIPHVEPTPSPVVTHPPVVPVVATPTPTPTPTPPAIIVGPTPIPRVTIPPTVSLSDYLNNLKGGEQLAMVKGAPYVVDKPVDIKASNWILDGTGANATVAATPQSSVFRVEQSAHNVEIIGLGFIAGPQNAGDVLFRIIGGDKFTYRGESAESKAKITDGFGTVLITDQTGVSTNTLMQDIDCGVTISCTIFLTQSLTTVRRVKAAGSETLDKKKTETVFRTDPRNGNIRPDYIIFDDCEIHTVAAQKGAVEWRSCGIGCQMINGIYYDYVRVGQDGMTTADQSIGHLLIANNKWPKLPPAWSLPEHLMLKNGVIVVDNNDFMVDGVMQTVGALNQNMQVTFSRNRRHASGPGITPRAAIFNHDTKTDAATVVDDGGTIVPWAA